MEKRLQDQLPEKLAVDLKEESLKQENQAIKQSTFHIFLPLLLPVLLVQ
jgi:hypothetical protein